MPFPTPPSSEGPEQAVRVEDSSRWTQRTSARLLAWVIVPAAVLLACSLGLRHRTARSADVARAQVDLDRSLQVAGELLEQRTRHFRVMLATLLTQDATSELVELWGAGELERASLASNRIERSCEELLKLQAGVLGIELYSDKGKLFLSVACGGEPPSAFDVFPEDWFDAAQRKGEGLHWERPGILRLTRRHTAADVDGVLFGSLLVDFEQLAAPAVRFATSELHGLRLRLETSAGGIYLADSLSTVPQALLTGERSAEYCAGTLHMDQARDAALAGAAQQSGSPGRAGLILAVALLAAIWVGLQHVVLVPLGNLVPIVRAFQSGLELPAQPERPPSAAVLRPVLAAVAQVRALTARWRRVPNRRGVAPPAAPLDELALVTRSLREAVEICRANVAARTDLSQTFERRVAEQTSELQRGKQEADAASRAKSEFLADLARNLHAPLEGAQRESQALLQGDASDAQRTLAASVHGSTAGVLRVLDEVRDLGELEAGRVELQCVEFDLHTSVEDVADMLARTASAKGLELVTEILPGVPARVTGDPLRLCQVLGTLVREIVDRTSRGGILLRVSPSHAISSQQLFEVRSSTFSLDSAGGQRDAFAAVSRPLPASAGGTGGTGLGLAICRQLVRRMHGDISWRNTPEEGATFWFTAELPSVAGAALPELESVNFHGNRVLVVDDNDTSRRVLAGHLLRRHAAPALAAGAKEALTLMQEAVAQGRPFEALVVDLGLPDLDGMDLARWIKDDIDLMQVPLVLLTAGERQLGADAALFAAHLEKPVRAARLVAAMREILPEPAPEPEVEPTPAGSSQDPVAGPADEPLDSEPRGPLPDRSAAAVSASDTQAWAPEEPTRVLLAEATEQGTAHLLERLGYDVVAVTTGLEVLEQLDTGPFHAVLLDCELPEMDGFKVARRVRLRPDLKASMPVIAMTTGTARADRDRCVEAGMDDCIERPLSPRGLGATLKRWVSMSSHLSASELSTIAALHAGRERTPG